MINVRLICLLTISDEFSVNEYDNFFLHLVTGGGAASDWGLGRIRV